MATYSKADSQGGIKGKDGFGFTVEHVQDKFFGGGNHIWVQYAQGSTNINQGFGNAAAPTPATRPGASSKARRGRSARSAARPSRCTSTTRPTDGVSGTSYWPVGGRGSCGMTKNLKFLTEIGYSSRKPNGGSPENLTKVTIGPALSTGPDFWKRPELRLYVTYADFNKAAAAGPAQRPADQQDQRRVVRRAGRDLVLIAAEERGAGARRPRRQYRP